MKRIFIAICLIISVSNTVLAQKLNQYKYIVLEDQNMSLINWERFRDLQLELRSKGFIFLDKVTADIPYDQIIVMQVRDRHSGFGGRCTLKFYDLNYQTIEEFSGSSSYGWMPENDVSYAWKSVIKKIKKYKYVFTPIKHAEANESNVILMEKKGGVFYIDCEVNNIPLKFIFDTGASIVSLSAVEASIMIKNGSLTEDDIIGSTLGTIADGSITVGTRVILRKIKIGKYILRNIEASVSDNIDAPLLLGQSALSMLGTIEIDFENACITVKER